MPDEFDAVFEDEFEGAFEPRSMFSRIGVGHGGTSALDIAKSGLAGTARDVAQIPASFINQFFMGLPRTAAEAWGRKYPTESGVTSPAAKLLSYGAGAVGGFKNPLIKTLLSGGKLLPQIVKSAALGSISSYKGERPEDFFQPGTMATKAMVAGAVPMLAKGAEKPLKGLWNISKTGRDYIYNKIAAPTSQNINRFVKSRPELVQKALKLKNETVDVLRKYGFDRVSNPSAIEEEATAKFTEAMSRRSKVYGNKIDVRGTLGRMRDYYNSIKKVDPRNPILKEIDVLAKLKPAPKGFYAKGSRVPTSTQLNRHMRGENLTDIADEVRLTREEFVHMRRKIMDLYKKTDFDPKVLDIADALYDDAEKAGLEGISDARKLWREFKETSKVKGDIAKLEKFSAEKIHSDVQSVIHDPKKYKVMIDRYTPYLGEREAKKIFDEAMNIRSGEAAKRRLITGTKIGVPTAAALGVGRSFLGNRRGEGKAYKGPY